MREQVLDEIRETLGSVPGWLSDMPDDQLEREWPRIAGLFRDTALSAREKALVGYAAAAAAHCPY